MQVHGERQKTPKGQQGGLTQSRSKEQHMHRRDALIWGCSAFLLYFPHANHNHTCSSEIFVKTKFLDY